MATKKNASKKKPPQSGLLSCTDKWRVYLSDKLTLNAKGGSLPLDRVQNGVPGAGQAEVRVTDNTDQIVLHEGFDPAGNKSIFLVRVPRINQIFKPKKK